MNHMWRPLITSNSTTRPMLLPKINTKPMATIKLRKIERSWHPKCKMMGPLKKEVSRGLKNWLPSACFPLPIALPKQHLWNSRFEYWGRRFPAAARLAPSWGRRSGTCRGPLATGYPAVPTFSASGGGGFHPILPPRFLPIRGHRVCFARIIEGTSTGKSPSNREATPLPTICIICPHLVGTTIRKATALFVRQDVYDLGAVMNTWVYRPCSGPYAG